MKTVSTLQAQARPQPLKVNKLPINSIIHLTSENFAIFVTAIATLICLTGVCIDNDHMVGYGGIVFLTGFIPRAIRQTARDVRQSKIGL